MYFRTYEFSTKQTQYREYWRRVLTYFFNQLKQKAMVLFEEIEQTFTIDGNMPMGLASVILDLSSQ